VSVDEHTVVLASATAYYRSVPARHPDHPIPVYIHGVPVSSDVWDPVLERTGGIALDLPGFGRSDKGGQLDYTVHGLAGMAAELIDQLALGPVALIGHEWGAVIALELAASRPEQVTRVVLVDPLGLASGFTWPRVARIWRTRGVGELAMGAITRRVLARSLRGRAATPQAWSEERVKAVWEQFDQGTQRAILRLHRGTSHDHLAQLAPFLAEADLEALVLFGEQDRDQGAEHAQRVAALLPRATVRGIPGAGHWPWLDRPEAAEIIAAFLEAP
jgi:pimeloyl-ACP methyl ester carboxylesterase